jgi:hypothetical protein
MKYIKTNDTVVSGKVLLRVESWENDGDNYRTEEVLLENMERAEEIVNILKKHKGYGNGEWNPECTRSDKDIIGDYVGYECHGGEVRVLESIELITFDIVGLDIIKAVHRVDLYE